MAKKYVQMYDMYWDEIFQIEVDDGDTLIPRAMAVSDMPFPGLKIRPRSIGAANRQREEEARYAVGNSKVTDS